MINKKIKKEEGQSLLEILIAISFFMLISGSIIFLILGSFNSLNRNEKFNRGLALAQEGVESVRSIQDRAWNEISYSTSSVLVDNDKWIFQGENSFENIGNFKRVISFDDVCRNEQGEITDCPGLYSDPHSKKINSLVSWNDSQGSIVLESYLTNWDSKNWIQTDWSGGPGQGIWSNTSRFNSSSGLNYSDNGQVTLIAQEPENIFFDFSLGSDLNYNWPFDSGVNYSYDSGKIEVSGGFAELIGEAGSFISGTTINSTFLVSSDGWNFSSWDLDGGEESPIGSWEGAGGNPDGYINVTFPYSVQNKRDQVGGYWEQSILVSENNSDVVCSFDWIIDEWQANNLNDYQLYVFLDNYSGEPVIGNEIWSSGTQNGITSWAEEDLNCSAQASVSGTYYFKLAVWIDNDKNEIGPIRSGFDNAQVYWEKSVNASYPDDNPSISPLSSFTGSNINLWSGFSEDAIKNGGEIYYQLSDDNGLTWYYWDGLSWVMAGENDYNIASVINSNISGFNTSNDQINFKAFLSSDGSQFIQLDNIELTYSQSSLPWNFLSWSLDGSEEILGNQISTGGNPDGYINIQIPDKFKNSQFGGYWEYQLDINEIPNSATLDFDYKVIENKFPALVSDIRVYLDSTSGSPVNQVGNSIPITEEGDWISLNDSDLISLISSTGTYYLKIGFWFEAGSSWGGQTNIGFDNVNISLGSNDYIESGFLTSSFFNLSDNSPVQVIEWSGNEPANCDIKLQVRTAPDNSGNPGVWTVWSGIDGEDSYFTNSYGSLIPSFLNGNQWVQYRFELLGNGIETPILEEINLNYK
jgi:type II secretory pathway pseudopilin PulG